MGFFDLNIPYTESNKRISTSEKSNRLKLAVKAMELGYTGVAYNRTITGVMSEVDRCSISLFPISSVLKVSPSISTSVNFHRRLLNVPTATPFRQYTRLTVVVDTPAQGSALNSGNPVLKTYDIVAVRPLKQDSFDQACKNYEVDIIAIDFSENRFRLKQPLIKAAIERGVHFEITYSGLIMDAQLRRQMISNAKLLVDWTRGKNLIFSSAAPSVTELRGPYDVANLAFLLGFSMERAKAAVSKTCRSLLTNALRKKKFYKEAIRVELISSAEQFDIDGAASDDWLQWDPISSGEGDLHLDDMAKSFAASSKASKPVKAIDFSSIIDGLPSQGLHIKADKSFAVYNVPKDSEFHDLPKKDQILATENVEKDRLLNFGNSSIFSKTENLEALASVEEGETCAMIIEEEKIQSDSNVCFSSPESEQQNPLVEFHERVFETNGTSDEKCSIPTLEKDTRIANPGSILPISSEEAIISSLDAPIHQPIIALNEVGIELIKGDSNLLSDASFHEEFPEREHMRDTRDVTDSPVSLSLPLSSASLNEDVPEEHVRDISVAPLSTLASLRSHDVLQNNRDGSVHEPLGDVSMEDQVKFEDYNLVNRLNAYESSSERVKRKQWTSRGSISFPFKRLLRPSHFKKVRKLRTKSTIT